MKSIDFFYFFGSGYAYLSVMRIGRVAAEAGAEVRWRPFNVRTVMAENNIALRNQPAKVAYLWRDIARRAAVHGIPFVGPPVWPTDPDLLANRVGVLASAQGWAEQYTLASFRSWYLEGRPLGEVGVLAAILEELGRDSQSVLAEAQSDAAMRRLERETDVARSFRVFGSPSFVVDGEMFWGDDRLEEALQWAAGRHPLQATGGRQELAI